MTTSRKSSARIRITSGTGTTAAPVTASRSEDRSCPARAGWSSSEAYSVGGPGSTVTRSCPMRRIASAASNTGCEMIVAPRIRQASSPAL